jgi:hypothetical protein
VVLVPGEGHPPAKLAGRALVRLSIDGLTDSARAALEARLSVREGDILSAAMIERIGTELHQFDEDFEANWTIEADKGGARLRIAPRQ